MNIKHWDNTKKFGPVSDTGAVGIIVVLPVQPERMKERRQTLHDQKDGHSENGKQAEHRHQEYDPKNCVHFKSYSHHHGPQHLWQLCERKEHEHHPCKEL